MSILITTSLLLFIFYLYIKLKEYRKLNATLQVKILTLLQNESNINDLLSMESHGGMNRVIRNIKNSIIQLEEAILTLSTPHLMDDTVNEKTRNYIFLSYCDQINSLACIIHSLSNNTIKGVSENIITQINRLFKDYDFKKQSILILKYLRYDSHSFEYTKLMSNIEIFSPNSCK